MHTQRPALTCQATSPALPLFWKGHFWVLWGWQLSFTPAHSGTFLVARVLSKLSPREKCTLSGKKASSSFDRHTRSSKARMLLYSSFPPPCLRCLWAHGAPRGPAPSWFMALHRCWLDPLPASFSPPLLSWMRWHYELLVSYLNSCMCLLRRFQVLCKHLSITTYTFLTLKVICISFRICIIWVQRRNICLFWHNTEFLN